MNTKSLIKEKSRQLFNEQGIMNVTLRNVAEQLNKSYGNITYHFATKEFLIADLFDEMNEELVSISQPPESKNLLAYFLLLPEISYEITLKYLFFTIDINEIKRNYPEFFSKIQDLNDARKLKWFSLLRMLLNGGYLKSNTTTEDLNYIMFLSASVRTMYFQFTEKSMYEKTQFVQAVNLLVKPYLSEKGLIVYQEYQVD